MNENEIKIEKLEDYNGVFELVGSMVVGENTLKKGIRVPNVK